MTIAKATPIFTFTGESYLCKTCGDEVASLEGEKEGRCAECEDRLRFIHVAKAKVEAAKMTRAEILDYFSTLCGPHLDPEIYSKPDEELREAYVLSAEGDVL